MPNALGVHAANLIRLAHKTGEAKDRERADLLMTVALRTVPRAPLAHGSVLNAFDLARNGVEVILVGSARAAFHAAARRLPYTTTLLIDCPYAEALPAGHPAEAMIRHAGDGAAFICFAGRCLPPVTDPNRLAEVIAAGR